MQKSLSIAKYILKNSWGLDKVPANILKNPGDFLGFPKIFLNSRDALWASLKTLQKI